MTTSTSFSFRELPRAASGERWRIAGWVLAAWTLVGFFRAVDRYFSDPFQLHRLEFGLWEALAQSLLASTIWALFTPPVVWLARRCVPTRGNWIVPIARLAAGGVVFADRALRGVPARLSAAHGLPARRLHAARGAPPDAAGSSCRRTSSRMPRSSAPPGRCRTRASRASASCARRRSRRGFSRRACRP